METNATPRHPSPPLHLLAGAHAAVFLSSIVVTSLLTGGGRISPPRSPPSSLAFFARHGDAVRWSAFLQLGAAVPLVGKNTALQNLPQAWPEEAIRAIAGKTMIVIGDADGVEMEHAVKLFKLRGGGDVEVAVKGFMDKAPRARLAILPATSHIGIMAQANLIAELATPFLDDVTPPIPPGFLPEGNAQATQGATSRPTRRDPRS